MEKAKLVILLLDSGKIEVNGPLHDKILCYGLLEIAKDVVKSCDIQSKIMTTPIMLHPKIQG